MYEFRLPRMFVWMGSVGPVLCTALAIGLAVTEPVPSNGATPLALRILALFVIYGFLTFMTAGGVYLLALYRRYRVTITEHRIVEYGLWRKKEVALQGEVMITLRRGNVVVRGSDTRIKISQELRDRSTQLPPAEILVSLVPEACQQDLTDYVRRREQWRAMTRSERQQHLDVSGRLLPWGNLLGVLALVAYHLGSLALTPNVVLCLIGYGLVGMPVIFVGGLVAAVRFRRRSAVFWTVLSLAQLVCWGWVTVGRISGA